MGYERAEGQLELFAATGPASMPTRRLSIGRVSLSLRYDHLVVASIGALIGSAIIFAFGVERGKQLARSEHRAPLLPARALAQEAPVSPQPTAPRGAVPSARAVAERPRATPQKERTPGKTRYAIQVVTYSRVQFARREMQRLEATGERAFLVTGDGRTQVYVGPFTTKANASEKLLALRERYHDCFVRSL